MAPVFFFIHSLNTQIHTQHMQPFFLLHTNLPGWCVWLFTAPSYVFFVCGCMLERNKHRHYLLVWFSVWNSQMPHRQALMSQPKSCLHSFVYSLTFYFLLPFHLLCSPHPGPDIRQEVDSTIYHATWRRTRHKWVLHMKLAIKSGWKVETLK